MEIEGWTEHLKMASGHVFGHADVSYRSPEAKTQVGLLCVRKREGWTEHAKMASGHVFGHADVSYRSPEAENSNSPDFGYGN